MNNLETALTADSLIELGESISSVNSGGQLLFPEHELNNEATRLADLREFLAASHAALTPNNWQEIISATFNRLPNLQYPQHRLLAKGWCARLLEDAYFVNRPVTGTAVFGQQLTTLLHDKYLPDLLISETEPTIGGKRQPSLIESIEATIERYTIIEQLPDIFSSYAEATILAGSMNHSPFFNIRKRAEPPRTYSSDIDILVVGNIDPTLRDENSIFTDASKVSFQKRFEQFRSLQQQERTLEFAHRFDVANQAFNVSIHSFSPETFSALLHDQLLADLHSEGPTVHTIPSFKPTPYSHSQCVEKGFDGSSFVYDVPPQRAVEGGHIADIIGYAIADGKFYPGFWHNMLLPQAPVLMDQTGFTTDLIRAFYDTLSTRIAFESESAPESCLLNAVVRSGACALDRYNRHGEKTEYVRSSQQE